MEYIHSSSFHTFMVQERHSSVPTPEFLVCKQNSEFINGFPTAFTVGLGEEIL